MFTRSLKVSQGPFGILTWELAALGLPTGDTAVYTGGPVGKLGPTRVFAVVTWLSFVFRCTSPLLLESFQNFMDAVVMLVDVWSFSWQWEVAMQGGVHLQGLLSGMFAFVPLSLQPRAFIPL